MKSESRDKGALLHPVQAISDKKLAVIKADTVQLKLNQHQRMLIEQVSKLSLSRLQLSSVFMDQQGRLGKQLAVLKALEKDVDFQAKIKLFDSLNVLLSDEEFTKSAVCTELVEMFLEFVHLPDFKSSSEIKDELMKRGITERARDAAYIKAKQDRPSPGRIKAKEHADEWTKHPYQYSSFEDFCRSMEDQKIASESSVKRWRERYWILGPKKPKYPT